VPLKVGIFFQDVAPCGFVGNSGVSEKHTLSVLGPEGGASMFLREDDVHLRVHVALPVCLYCSISV
jgi:hypothetical protein